jgi:signal transduction histidine kinase/CheY-like chemotaxis protein/predicted HTH domain antitoxin
MWIINLYQGIVLINIPNLKEKIAHADAKIESSDNNIEINKIIEDIIIDITQAEYASIWIYENKKLVRERSKEKTVLSMEDKEGLIYKCFATKHESIENHITSIKGYVATVDNPDDIKLKSKIMIPIVVRDVFLGIVTAYISISNSRNFSRNDLDIFQAIKPFVIDTIVKMNTNNGKELIIKRRSSTTVDNGERRRRSDVDISLGVLEEKRAEKTNEVDMLGYVSNIVHDIRTPANGLMGFLEILEEKIDDKRIKEYILNAKKSAILIESLTTSILDGVSTKQKPTHTTIETINTLKFFSDIAEIFSANMSKKNISYPIFIDPRLPKEIEIDTIKLHRTIMNLIGNAYKFTPENGVIKFFVTYKKSDKKISIAIQDNGIGIAKEKQSTIFEAFKQAEKDTKDKFGGTGLGLSICATYVKELGGILHIDSQLDKGSTFYFDIPIRVIDDRVHFEAIKTSTIYITILCAQENSAMVNHIAKYFLNIGLRIENINAITNIENIASNTTHLIIFENKMNADLGVFVEEKNLKSLIVEENFLSLNIAHYPDSIVVSQYSDMGPSLYSFVRTKDVPKVLIVEDDHISIMLLKAMLIDEYCDIDTAMHGEDGLELLTKAWRLQKPYDIVYTDLNMPFLSGSKMLESYLTIADKPITSVCISGDVNVDDSDFTFDYLATKPFSKQEIISILHTNVQVKEL